MGLKRSDWCNKDNRSSINFEIVILLNFSVIESNLQCDPEGGGVAGAGVWTSLWSRGLSEHSFWAVVLFPQGSGLYWDISLVSQRWTGMLEQPINIKSRRQPEQTRPRQSKSLSWVFWPIRKPRCWAGRSSVAPGPTLLCSLIGAVALANLCSFTFTPWGRISYRGGWG